MGRRGKNFTAGGYFKSASPNVYQEWGEFYLARESLQAVKYFQTALALDTKNSNILLGLAHAYYQEHNANAILFYDRYLQANPQDYWGYIELARWLREDKHDAMALRFLNRAIELVGYLDEAYVDEGPILDDHGQYKQEEEIYLKGISMLLLKHASILKPWENCIRSRERWI